MSGEAAAPEDPTLARVEGWCAGEGIPAERFANDAVMWGLHLRYPRTHPRRIDLLRPKGREGVVVFHTGLALAQGQAEALASMAPRERTDLAWDMYMFIVEHGAFAAFSRKDGVLSKVHFQRELFFDELSRPAFLAGLGEAHGMLVWLMSAVQRACGRERAAAKGRAAHAAEEELPMFR